MIYTGKVSEFTGGEESGYDSGPILSRMSPVQITIARPLVKVDDLQREIIHQYQC